MPNIRGPRLAEFREDVVNATLLAILLSKGVVLEPDTAPWQPRNAVSRACGQRVRPPSLPLDGGQRLDLTSGTS